MREGVRFNQLSLPPFIVIDWCDVVGGQVGGSSSDRVAGPGGRVAGAVGRPGSGRTCFIAEELKSPRIVTQRVYL